ncbi:MAG: UDP-N-acetylmuramate--L-alanine ligase [Caldilineaceae bacterium]|nr:UDP-N-acetylmuramate--L-alanine ligase [Caldilineaceae bacterium]
MNRLQKTPSDKEPISAEGWRKRLSMGDPSLHVHLLGIGGAGLGPIAIVLREMGFHVSGSDAQMNPRLAVLAERGITVYPGQIAENLTAHPESRPDVVLISSAVGVENPERRAAEDLGIPIVKRREFLMPMLAQRSILAVAGAHGKSTTTAMIVQILQECGVDAGYIVGSELPIYGSAHAGSSPYFVIEADEYDHMFLGLMPQIAVITNVEWDHPDCYPSPQSFYQAFAAFTAGVPAHGLIVGCGDDEGVATVRREYPTSAPWIRYGLGEDVDLRAVDAHSLPNGGYCAAIHWRGTPIGQLSLQVPGLHNLRNALAALAVARSCHLPDAEILAALGHYQGVARRFELKGEQRGVTVIDDYAHHPTEVRATLAAVRARYGDRQVWAVVQPHTFSRTRELLHAMAASFGDADHVIVADIYAARERDDGTLSAADLVAASDHPHIEHISGLEAIADSLAVYVEADDVVITLGAGTSYRVGEILLERLLQHDL